MKTRLVLILSGATVLFASGCVRTLYFGTTTSTGLNVSGTNSVPTNVSLAYQRGEIAVVPKGKNGETLSVFGGADYDYSWTEGFVLNQRFATGAAAHIAIDPNQQPGPNNNQDRTMLFTTGTDFGLKLHLGESTGQSPSFLFGHRRAEAVIMPLREDATEANSVYADISITYDNDGKLHLPARLARRPDLSSEQLPSSDNGLRIKQRFATGKAAELLVQEDHARAKLFAAAGVTPPPEISVTDTAVNLARRVAKVTDGPTRVRLLAAAQQAASEFSTQVMPPGNDPAELERWLTTMSDGRFAPVLQRFEHLAGVDLPK